MKYFLLIICGIILIALTVIGLGISSAVIYSNGTSYLSRDEPCPVFPIQKHYTAEKQIWDRWHWTYQFKDFDGKIEMKCPTSNRDTDVLIDDKLVVRSDLKLFSYVSLNTIKDCHGDVIYISRISEWYKALIYKNIAISFELTDATDQNTLAYIEGVSFFGDNFDIKDTNGVTVAHLSRNFFNIPWKWEFEIFHPNSSGADMRVLTQLAGVKSFEKSGDDDGGDGCNSYFWNVSIVVLVVVCFSVVGLIGVIICCVYTGYKKGKLDFFLE